MGPYVAMLLGAGAFATMSAFAHALGKQLAWPYVAAFRAAIPLVIAGGLAWFAGAKFVFWRPWTLWWRSIAGSISLVLAFFALTRPTLPVADVVTVTNLFPIWIAVLSWPLLGCAPSFRVWLAIGLGITGVFLIQQPHLSKGDFGFLAALGSSVFSALALLGLNRLRGIDARAIVVHFSFVALVFSGVAIAVGQETHPTVSWRQTSFQLGMTTNLLLGLGVFATIGQILLTKAFTLGEPAKVSVVGLSQVGFAMIYDILLWDRHFNSQSLAGIVLVLAPTAWLLLSSRGTPSPATVEESGGRLMTSGPTDPELDCPGPSV